MEMVSFSSILFGREGPKLLKNKISTHPTTPGAPLRLHLAWSDGVSSATQIDRVPHSGYVWRQFLGRLGSLASLASQHKPTEKNYKHLTTVN